MYFQRKYGQDGAFRSYNSFKSYVRANKLNEVRSDYLKTHVRYETDLGEELQVDWKESLQMRLKSGEVIHYNLYTAVFGYSRYVKFIYPRQRLRKTSYAAPWKRWKVSAGNRRR